MRQVALQALVDLLLAAAIVVLQFPVEDVEEWIVRLWRSRRRRIADRPLGQLPRHAEIGSSLQVNN